MRSYRTLGLAIALAVVGCKKDPPASSGAIPAPSPASIQAADALWALAPEGTRMGVVATPRAVQMIEGAVLSLRALLATAPELDELAKWLDNDVMQGASSLKSLADAGLSRDRGFATFGTDAGSVMIIPVADRDKMMATFHATKEGDIDKVGTASCKPVKTVYACTDSLPLLETLGKGNVRSKLDVAKARGEIEILIGLPDGGLGNAAVVAQLDRGRVMLRGAITGASPLAAKLGKGGKPRTDFARSSSFGIADLSPFVDAVPTEQLVPGLSLVEIVRSFAGPITLDVPAGSVGVDVRIPLSDPGPVTKLIENCSTVFPAPLLAPDQKGGCRLAPPQVNVELDLWVDNKTFRIGNRSGAGTGKSVPMSPEGVELANNTWALAFWGRGTAMGTTNSPFTAPGVDPRGLRAMGLFNELGMAARLDGDVIRFVATARSIWANPDDVVAKLIALPTTEFSSVDKVKAIATASPSSPFARDFTAGHGGLMVPSVMVGFLMAILVPRVIAYTRGADQTAPVTP